VDQPGPVTAWQIVHLKGVDRRPVARSTSGITDHYVLDHVVPGRIGTKFQLEFFAAFVVIEAAALNEATLVQVADYVVMRSLVRSDPVKATAQPAPTILSLFEPGGVSATPLSVTHWDLALVRALYDTQMANSAKDQQRQMARLISETLGNGSNSAE
jgi:hypothetical protein